MNTEIEQLRADYGRRSRRRQLGLRLALAGAWIVAIAATVLMVLA